jgi:hypothetical protein
MLLRSTCNSSLAQSNRFRSLVQWFSLGHPNTEWKTPSCPADREMDATLIPTSFLLVAWVDPTNSITIHPMNSPHIFLTLAYFFRAADTKESQGSSFSGSSCYSLPLFLPWFDCFWNMGGNGNNSFGIEL